MPKTAVITGVSGQDGSYLAELLLEKGYHVVGVVRRTSSSVFPLIEHLRDRIDLRFADLLDMPSLAHLMQDVQPDEVYNLAAQSFVGISWQQPELTSDVTALGALRVLEAIRLAAPKARFYQASSSEMFGACPERPLRETSRFYPRSPYAVSKVFAHYLTVNYRESYGMFAVSGILFNHESPRRGIEFVTRKITDGVARIKAGRADTLTLGNLKACRDWGFAGDYVRAMWLMLQQDEPRDFVIGTGRAHSVEDFCRAAFERVGLDYRKHVQTDAKFERPAEVEYLIAGAESAHEILGWRPEVNFDQLAGMMVDADLTRHGVKQA